MPDTEHTEIVERLRAFGDDLTTDDRWTALVARARARRRRRSVATLAAAAAVVAVAAGGLAVARPGASRNAVPVPAASPSPSGIDPWADPMSSDPSAPGKQPTIAAYRGGVRLGLFRDEKGTYAITVGMDKGKICFRLGGAVPAGSRPLLRAAGCTDDSSTRALWVPYGTRVGGVEASVVLVAPAATRLVWRHEGREVPLELHDLPGSGRKVALLAESGRSVSSLVAFAGSRTLATYEIGPRTAEPAPSPEPAPRPEDAVALFTYKKTWTLWAERQGDGTVRFVGTAPGVPGAGDTFGGVPPGPDKPVREASLDRVTFGERWVCGTAQDDVRTVVYRLADGRTVRATLHQVPKGGRVWCVKLPRERLDKPPAKGDLIVATLRNGTRYEVAPKY